MVRLGALENIKTDSGILLWGTGNPLPLTLVDIVENSLKHTEGKDNLISYASSRRYT